MKYLKLQVLIVLSIIFTLLVTPVSGSDISNAQFKGVLTLTNASTKASLVSANVTNLNTTTLINGGYLNASVTNTAITNTSGADLPFMPGYQNTAWMVWLGSMPTGHLSALLYTGNVTGGKIRYFPGAGGLSTNDTAGLELGNNFAVELAGYFNTGTQIKKDNSFEIKHTGTAIVGGVPCENTVFYASDLVLLDSNTRVGQRINNLPSATIPQTSVYLRSIGSATGTVSIRLRKVSDDSIIGTFGSRSADSISSAYTWYTFSTPVSNPVTQDVYLTVEYNGVTGGYLLAGANNQNTYPFGFCALYTSGTWVEYPALDTMFKLDLTLPGVSAPLSPGEHTIKVYADGTNLKLDVNGVNVDTTLLSASIPNSAAAWTCFASNSMPYVEFLKISVNGGLRQHLAWQYATILTDLSGQGNNPASVSFATSSSHADISGTMTSFAPASANKAPAQILTMAPDLISTDKLVTGNFTTTIDPVDFPLSKIIEDAALLSGTPIQLPYLIISGFLIIIMSLLVSWLMRQHTTGSVFIKLIVIAVAMSVCVALRIYDPWMLIIFGFLAIAAAMASKQQSWG